MTLGLTDEDRAKLADMATNGVLPYTNSSRAPAPPAANPTSTACRWCGDAIPDGWCASCAAEEFLYRCGVGDP